MYYRLNLFFFSFVWYLLGDRNAGSTPPLIPHQVFLFSDPCLPLAGLLSFVSFNFGERLSRLGGSFLGHTLRPDFPSPAVNACRQSDLILRTVYLYNVRRASVLPQLLSLSSSLFPLFRLHNPSIKAACKCLSSYPWSKETTSLLPL